MIEHLGVQKYIEQLRGYGMAQPEPYYSALERIADEIDRLVGITYKNFLTRGEQLQAAKERIDGLEAKLKLAQSPTTEQESGESVPAEANEDYSNFANSLNQMNEAGQIPNGSTEQPAPETD